MGASLSALAKSIVLKRTLVPYIQFTHRVVNKVPMETGFPCIPISL